MSSEAEANNYWLWFLLRLVARLVLLLGFRVRVFGQGHVPETGGALIASNHQSFFDPSLLIIALRRVTSFMARRTLFRRAGFAWLIRSLNTFPVARGGVDTAAMREAVRRLRSGRIMVVFPEGTRTADGSIGRLRPGVLSMAVRAHVPIVPAAIDGAFEAWPRGRAPWFHPIAVRYGRAISPDECEAMTRVELVARLRADLLALQSALKRRAIHAAGGSAVQ